METEQSLVNLYFSPKISDLLNEVTASRLADEIGERNAFDRNGNAVSQLRVAAYISLGETFGEYKVDDLLRFFSSQESAISAMEGSIIGYENWNGYLNALKDEGIVPEINELLSFSSIAFLARKPHEVRRILTTGHFNK